MIQSNAVIRKENIYPGGEIIDFFSPESLAEVLHLCSTLEADKIEHIDQVRPELQQVYNISSSRRESINLAQNQYPELHAEIVNTLTRLFPTFKELTACTLWRDYPGYTNNYHRDDKDSVRNIVIVYLMDDPLSGTAYIHSLDDGTNDWHYCQPALNKAFYLFDSTRHFHAMGYFVPPGVVRQTLYLNFLTIADE